MLKKQLHYRAGYPRSTSKIADASQLQLEKQRELKRLTTSLCVQMDASTLTQWKALNMNRGWGGRLHGIENVMRRAKWGDISLLKLCFAAAVATSAESNTELVAQHVALAAALRLRPQNMKCFEEALQRTLTELWKAEKCKRVVAQTDDNVAGSGTADPSPNALASRQPALLLLLEAAKRRMASGLQLLLREDDLDNHPPAARAVSGNRVEPLQDAVEQDEPWW